MNAIEKLKNRQTKSEEKEKLVSDFIKYLHIIGIRPSFVVIPSILSLLAAVFEGANAALLVPLVRGVVKMDFGFVMEMPVFKDIQPLLPKQIIISNTTIFALLIGLVFVFAILKNVTQYLARISLAYKVRRMCHNARVKVFNRYLTFGKLFFDRSNTGDLNNALTTYPDEIGSQMFELNTVVHHVFMLTVYVALMFRISWELTLGIIAIFPFLYYSNYWLIEKIKQTSRYYIKAKTSISNKIFNILTCIPLVKAYTREREEEKEFSRLSGRIAEVERSMDKKSFLIYPLQESIIITVILLIVSAAAFIVVREKREVAGFLVYFYLIKRAAESLGVFTKLGVILGRTSAFVSVMLKVFDDKDKAFVSEGKMEFGGLKNSIEFKNLNFSYVDKIQVLDNVKFMIEKGKVTALVGETGAGKSTLVNLLLRFYDHPPSTIFADGVDIREFSLRSLRSRMAFVSQDILLFNDTLRSNIVYGVDRPISEDEIMETIGRARLSEFIKELPAGLNTPIGDRGAILSGGEKQRVSIARALLRKAEILILDEATSSLDVETEKLVREAIAEVIKDKTVIIIAHRLSTIKSADKIVVIENGTVAEQGSFGELIERKGKFHQYWETQSFIG